ncbi:DUF3617 domain-containing protein [Sphingomicrobium sp. XHP0239]|uniref:DUF3617 domain-containing protein n=1 Tax=Sphingomicrobium maritimum TaxID=3133972 RepID=UPI0031CCB282
MRTPIILAALLALGACGQNADEAEAQPETNEGLSAEDIENEMGSAMSRGDFLSPGLWESSIRLDSIDMPGLTDAQRDDMRTAMGGQTFRTCLTRAEVERPDARFFTGNDTDCTYDSFTLEDGRIESDLVCTIAGTPQRMSLAGEYGPERYDLTMQADSLAQDGITMAMRVEARRVGACEEE